jgi:hypothetical protein
MVEPGLGALRLRTGEEGRVYHIDAVDCVTQWEIVATCDRLSEAYLAPVIKAMLELEGFPFTISRCQLPCRQRLEVHHQPTRSAACWRSTGREHPAEDGPGDVGRR